ncbi:hypothetical protein [Streptomyces vietnamensis]|uniref:Uncharacterized protein n=1 Tax=Streptomyces vietnamensis TaxID=362257 RepID=A0A0B5ICQ9_9ACTN|nr:hypothetical protein [Streptomyces vietnamensis]AJF70306.1 hypothetical protein SVTN_39435 [Streptomyces vietnamensis]
MEPIALRDAILAALEPVTGLEGRPIGGELEDGLVYGLVTRTGGGEAWWQILVRTTPESRPPAPDLDPAPVLPTSGPVRVGDIELLFAHAAMTAGAVTATRYSTRATPPALKYGVHAEFEDETAAFIQLQWVLRPGEERRDHTRGQHRDEV